MRLIVIDHHAVLTARCSVLPYHYNSKTQPLSTRFTSWRNRSTLPRLPPTCVHQSPADTPGIDGATLLRADHADPCPRAILRHGRARARHIPPAMPDIPDTSVADSNRYAAPPHRRPRASTARAPPPACPPERNACCCP